MEMNRCILCDTAFPGSLHYCSPENIERANPGWRVLRDGDVRRRLEPYIKPLGARTVGSKAGNKHVLVPAGMHEAVNAELKVRRWPVSDKLRKEREKWVEALVRALCTDAEVRAAVEVLWAGPGLDALMEYTREVIRRERKVMQTARRARRRGETRKEA